MTSTLLFLIGFALPIPVQAASPVIGAPVTLTVIALAFSVKLPVTLILPTVEERPPAPVKEADAPELKLVAPPIVTALTAVLASVALEATVTAEGPMEPPGPNASMPELTVVAPL